ncbi:RPM1-interacting protein 4-like [Cynara cardunculus var. scolymus]|uniref:RPM1-interacting protein 4-like n=1 Tax=Cynara cardunculus var. scolymus TaxID=59895 RepID=UPI000D62C13D|nr:RPM1-interacting protein 4-like [Cynara cardunculus var. scolymus]
MFDYLMQQQQRSHIPKFGSWDADNVPYTAYFDNARKDKGTTGVMFNPNDPEENPEAFMTYGGGYDDGNNDHKIVFADKNMKTSMTSSDKGSISDISNNQQSYKSDPKKSSNSERLANFSPPSPSPGPHRPKYGYNPADDIVSHRSASVPMFGAWDEKDPRSAEGFTVIFQKVKEEKHIAATKFPPIPQHPTSNHPNTPKHDNTRRKVGDKNQHEVASYDSSRQWHAHLTEAFNMFDLDGDGYTPVLRICP